MFTPLDWLYSTLNKTAKFIPACVPFACVFCRIHRLPVQPNKRLTVVGIRRHAFADEQGVKGYTCTLLNTRGWRTRLKRSTCLPQRGYNTLRLGFIYLLGEA